MLTFDHLAIGAETLHEGLEAVEAALGVPLEPGGLHPDMGTHNRLLSLGPGAYLEVVAIDPKAKPPPRPRWFALDDFRGPPRPCAWIARTADLPSALALAPEGAGTPLPLCRGPYAWQMAVPDTGLLPYGGLFPAIIAWSGDAHPADALPDRGVRLRRLTLTHPEAGALRAALSPLLREDRVAITLGAQPQIAAELDTPQGLRVLA